MAAPERSTERAALRWSIAATAALGAVAVAWGIAVRSQMILFDGVYAVLGLIVSWALLRASTIAAEPPTARYPFGREAITPLAIGVQGIVLLATMAYAVVEAIYTIRAGGSDVATGWALTYAVVTAAASIAFWLWIRVPHGTSDLLASEEADWRVGTLRSVGMIGGFALIGVLDGSRWSAQAPYIDSAMVLVTCLVCVRTPVRMIRTTVSELLERAPDATIQTQVDAIVADVGGAYRVDEHRVRVVKVGAKLYVEVEAVAEPQLTIADEHNLRQHLERRLDALPYDIWLTVELHPPPLLEKP
jgi:cation diffusion facilitator family transporter